MLQFGHARLGRGFAPLAATLLLLLSASPTPAAEPAGGGDGDAGPLRLTPQDTVILDGGTPYAGRTLQYYLLRYYVGDAASEGYDLDGKADRAASPHFPLLTDRPDAEMPAGKTVIAVGATRFLSADDRRRLEGSSGAVLLKRHGRVIVVAGSPLDEPWGGSLTAVSEFLNRVAGIRFYAPDELWTSRPREKVMTLAEGFEFFREQAFETVHLAPVIERNATWARMNGASRLTVSSNHNLAGIYPPERYAKTHPQIYEMRGGERRVPGNLGTQIWNPCLSADTLPDLAMDYIRERKKERPGQRYISMGMMDIELHCECEECQTSVKAHGGSYSDLYYGLLNEVARRCQKEFPGLLITSLLYSNARTPPVGMRIEPNVVVKVVTKTYKLVEPEYEAYEKGRIRAFSDLGAKWMIHDWSFSGVSPRNYLRQYAGFLQWAKQNGMVGAYVEWSPGESWYLDGAKYWVLLQLLNDPYQDVDRLWKTYCDDMYGPAAGETMFRFFQHFQDKFTYAPEHITLADLPRQEPALYGAEDLVYQRSLLERAAELSKGDDLVRQRLEKVMRYFRAHELFAKATEPPHRLDRTFAGKGVNKALLAWYVNDDGAALEEAIRFYDTQRTVAPDSSDIERRLGLRGSYIGNYTRGMAALLRDLRAQAREPGGSAAGPNGINRAEVERLAAESKRILHANLPEQRLPARVELFEKLLSKTLWVGTAATAPTIDGDLADPQWADAAVLDGFTERDTLKTPAHETSGKILRVGDTLVVGLVCKQAGPIWAQSPKDTLTGTHIWRESGMEFFVGPVAAGGTGGGEDGEAPPYAQYVVNAFGAFRGFAAAADNRAGVQAAAKLDADKGVYIIEAVFPLKAAGYDFTGEKALSFNVCRNVYTRDSYEADVILGWHPVFGANADPASRGMIFFD